VLLLGCRLYFVQTLPAPAACYLQLTSPVQHQIRLREASAAGAFLSWGWELPVNRPVGCDADKCRWCTATAVSLRWLLVLLAADGR